MNRKTEAPVQTVELSRGDTQSKHGAVVAASEPDKTTTITCYPLRILPPAEFDKWRLSTTNAQARHEVWQMRSRCSPY